MFRSETLINLEALLLLKLRLLERAWIVRKLELGRSESGKFKNSYGDLITGPLFIRAWRPSISDK